jgi:hypothetical protein
MAVQEVRTDKGSMVRAGDYVLSMEKETKVISWEQDFLYTTEQYHHLEFVSDRISYIVLRGCWCNVIVLNACAPNEEKSDDSKDSFHVELEQVFYHFPK